MSEILVVPRFHLVLSEGVRSHRNLPRVFYDLAEYKPREEMETDPTYKQVIPYVVLFHQPSLQVFTYWRSGAEKRLHGSRSLGVGGHINRRDRTIRSAAWREIHEEVEVPDVSPLQFHGLVNEDQTEVGRVHIGVLYIMDLGEPKVTPKDETAGGELASLDALDPDEFEIWSQHVIHYLREIV